VFREFQTAGAEYQMPLGICMCVNEQLPIFRISPPNFDWLLKKWQTLAARLYFLQQF